jgi:hypothetical protein
MTEGRKVFKKNKKAGKFRTYYVSTLGEAIRHERSLKKFARILDTRIYVFDSLDGKEYYLGFGAGKDDLGHNSIAINPLHNNNAILLGVLHEIKHILDMVDGKPMKESRSLVLKGNLKEYYNMPSEKRADRFAERYVETISTTVR